MADANRDACAKDSPLTAMRGRLSERAWLDVRRAARLAREVPGVALRVHNVTVTGLLKQQKVTPTLLHKVQKKPTESVAPTLPSAMVDKASPSPLNKRQQRSAQRLQEFQEKKRAARMAKELERKAKEEVQHTHTHTHTQTLHSEPPESGLEKNACHV